MISSSVETVSSGVPEDAGGDVWEESEEPGSDEELSPPPDPLSGTEPPVPPDGLEEAPPVPVVPPSPVVPVPPVPVVPSAPEDVGEELGSDGVDSVFPPQAVRNSRAPQSRQAVSGRSR